MSHEPFIEIFDRNNSPLRGNEEVARIIDALGFAEGPVWIPDRQSLVFSDIPNNRILEWTDRGGVVIIREPSQFANGNALDGLGRLLTCQHGTRSVVRINRAGQTVSLATSYRGRRFNSPNDIAVANDGVVWFTDPPYGLENGHAGAGARREIEGNYLFYISPITGQAECAVDDFDRPNGLAFSEDGRRLFVADSGALGANDHFDHTRPHHIRSFDVSEGGRLRERGVLITIDAGVPDGITVDAFDNIWSSASDGVRCYAQDGEMLAAIRLPEVATNVVISGGSSPSLFITVATGIYRVPIRIAD